MSIMLRCRTVGVCRVLPWATNQVAKKSKLARKKMPTEYALEHFDSFYKKIFDREWRSIRLGLLSEKKYCAVINPNTITPAVLKKMNDLGAETIFGLPKSLEHEAQSSLSLAELPEEIVSDDDPYRQETHEFHDSSRIIQQGNTEPLLSFVPATEMVYQEDVISEADYFNFVKPEEEVAVKSQTALPLPPLIAYTFPAGVFQDFPQPRKYANGLFEYYLMDAASILPVMALNIQKGEAFADVCAAPGGKTLSVAFTQLAGSHFCCDKSGSRTSRLKNIIGTYLPEEQRSNITVKTMDTVQAQDSNTYDKILVDVPCTNDRHSLFEDDSNIFHPSKTRDRIEIPEMQLDILKSSLRRLRPGGAAVYSTCSLSPIQNDGVVHMAIQSFKTRKFVVTDLRKTFEPLQNFFKFFDNCRYGQLVLPYLPHNFGPMYICRIERVK